jgi:hypothetical protein
MARVNREISRDPRDETPHGRQWKDHQSRFGGRSLFGFRGGHARGRDTLEQAAEQEGLL